MLLINLISHFCSWAKLVLGCFDLTPHWGYRLNPVMQPIPLQPKAASQQVAKKAGMPKCKAFKGRRSMYKTLQSHFPMDCQPRCWIVCTSTGFGWHCSSLCLDWATLKDLKDSFSPHPCTGDEVYDQVQLLAREVSEEEEDRIESSKVGYSSGGGVWRVWSWTCLEPRALLHGLHRLMTSRGMHSLDNWK